MATTTVPAAFQLQQQELPQGGPKMTLDALDDRTERLDYPVAEPVTSMSMPSVSRTVLAPYKCPVPGYSGPLGCKGTLGVKRKMQDLYYSYRTSHLHDDDTFNDDEGEVNGAAQAASKRRCCGEPSDATTVPGGFSIAGASAFRLEFEDGDSDDHAAASPMAATATSIRRLAPVTVPPLSRGRGSQVIPHIRRCSKIVRASGPDASAADTAAKEMLVEKLGVPGSGGQDASKQSIAAKVAAASMPSVAAPLSKVAAAAVPTGRFDTPLVGASTNLNNVLPSPKGPQAMAATLPVPLSPLAELPLSAMLTAPQPPVLMGPPKEEPIATGLREMEDFLTSLMREAPPLQTPTVPTEPVVLEGNPNVLRPAPPPLDVSDAPPSVIAALPCSGSSISARGPAGAPGSSRVPATGDCTHTPIRAMLLTKGRELPAPAVFNPLSAVNYTISPIVQTAETLGLNPSISPRPDKGIPEESALQLNPSESVLLLGTPSHRRGNSGDYSYQRGGDDGLPDGASQAPVVVSSWPTWVINGSMKPTEETPLTDTLPLVVATDCDLTVAVPDGAPGSSLDLAGGFAPSNAPREQCAPPALATSTASAFGAATAAVAHVMDEAAAVFLRPAGRMDMYEGAAKCANGSTEPRQEDHPCADTFHAGAAAAVVSLPDLAASVAVTPAAVASLAAANNLPAAGAVMADMFITLIADPITSWDAAVSADCPGGEAAADGGERPVQCASYAAAEQPTGAAIGVPAAGDANTAGGAAPALATETGPILEAVDALTCIGSGSGDTPSPAQLLLHGLDGGGGVVAFGGVDRGGTVVGAAAVIGQDVIMAKPSGQGEAQQDGDRATISKTRTIVLAVGRDDVGDNSERTMEPWDPPAVLPAVDALAAAAVERTVASGQSTIAAEAGAVHRMGEVLEVTTPTCDPAGACVFPTTAIMAAAAAVPDSNGNKQGTEETAGPERADILEVLAAGEVLAAVAVNVTAAAAVAGDSQSGPVAGAPLLSDFPSGCLQTSKIGGQGANMDGSLEFATLDSGSGGDGSPAAMSAEALMEAAVMAALSGM